MADSSPMITTPLCRISFPSLHKKAINKDGSEGKFEVTMLFPKDTDLAEIRKAAGDALIAKWPDKDKRPKGLHNPVNDGDEKSWDGYEGCFYIKAKTNRRPTVRDHNNKDVVDVEGEAYGGRWAKCKIHAYGYDNVTKGVSFGLDGVQLLSHDEAFGGGGPVDFDDVKIEAPAGGNDARGEDNADEDLFG